MESTTIYGQLLQPPNPPPGQISIECVINLEITDFSSRNKKHKVVISGPTADKTESISYKAKTPNKPPGAFDWRAGYDGGVKGFINYWGLAPLPMGTNFQREGNAHIPNAKHPLGNEDLGKAHGTVMVTEDGQTPGATINGVEVFFRKDDANPNDPNVPNWFYYWSKIPTENQNIVNIKFVDPETKVWATGTPVNITFEYINTGKYAFDKNKVYSPDDRVTYGTLVAGKEYIIKELIGNSSKGKRALPYLDGNNYGGKGFSQNPIIKIGHGCGFKDIGNDEVTGIGVFSTNFYHELEHWKIFYENWKDGYQTDLDLDNDGYNDEWEKAQDKKYEFRWEHKNFPKIEDDDTYNSNYVLPPEDSKNSSGTYYEEERCRTVQKLNTNSLNHKDWSFDPNKTYQGKQWK